MAIIFISETNDSIDKYDEVIVLLEERGLAHPTGRFSHVAASTGYGNMVVDVWESQELPDEFAQSPVPLIPETGGTTPNPGVHRVHNAVTPAPRQGQRRQLTHRHAARWHECTAVNDAAFKLARLDGATDCVSARDVGASHGSEGT